MSGDEDAGTITFHYQSRIAAAATMPSSLLFLILTVGVAALSPPPPPQVRFHADLWRLSKHVLLACQACLAAPPPPE